MMRLFKPRSIASRLALAYALAAAFVLSIAVVTLAYLEDAEIDVYQTNEIKNRFSLFAYDARHTTDIEGWKKLKQKYIQIQQEAEGRIYIRSDSDDPDYIIAAPFNVNPRHLNKHHGFSKQKINGNYFRAYSQRIPAAGDRPELILSLAVDAFFYEDFDQWLDLAYDVFLIFSILLITAIGIFLARRNLRPVHRLSAYASRISSHNISDRLPTLNLPTELKGLVESFNGVLERLHQSALHQAAFNSDVAHELRTPVGNLIGQTEVALSKPRQIEELENIMQSNLEELERLRSVINDMLFLSHADQGEIALKQQQISLRAETQSTAEFLEIILEDNHNTLSIEGDAQVLAEPNLLKRALTNLINNAAQHSTPGTPVIIKISSEHHQVCLTVINHGTPIPPTDLPKLFDRFYRVSKERKNSGANHGLGLSIVKAIITMHGGSVFARSENDKIEIGFTLPLTDSIIENSSDTVSAPYKE